VAFVITSGCCNDASCVDACPVDCIRPRPGDPQFLSAEQLYIDPASCIDCAACMYACPVNAIHDGYDLPDHLKEFVEVNSGYFVDHPLTPLFVDHSRRPTPPAPAAAKVAVVGSGPSGCYAVAELLKIPGLEVSMFDRLATPFGLVRSGVAPDHPDTKLITDYFSQVLKDPRVTCHLNVEVGRDITVEELLASHHAVIYAVGASADRALGIQGENLDGSHSARELVAWYNGHPDFADHGFDLRGRTAVILGNGNVALDAARILTKPVGQLAVTDIADHALEALRTSSIDHVVVAARRGPADAACTFPELLELTRTPGVEVRAVAAEVAGQPESGGPLSSRRKVELFQSIAREQGSAPHAARRSITFRFGLTPVDIQGDQSVAAIRLRPTGGSTSPVETIETGLVLRAIGYQVAAIEGLPFDAAAMTLSHRNGRLVAAGTSDALPGLYCVGWVKRGASGVIGTNKVCASETVDALVSDLRSGALAEPAMSSADLRALITSRQHDVLGFDAWEAIDARERRDGEASRPARSRRKIVSAEAMLDVARAATTLTP